MPDLIYNWSASRNLAALRLEGNGELLITPDGELLIRTFHLGPHRKAANVWFTDLTLPDAFKLSWRYRSESAAGNTMVIFNAAPILLQDIFEDSRPDARYCDLASWSKIVAYTCGFHRGTYNNPSVLRKIGGKAPDYWAMMNWPGDAWKEVDTITRFHTTPEPLTPADKGKWHDFVLERRGANIQFRVNGKQIHDETDTGQYPHHKQPLSGGRLAFRNFGGPADDFYADIRLEAL